MTRAQLEHILRAAAGITGADQFVVIGSQSILGAFPSAPDELTISMEADLFTLRSPADAELIDGTIGEGSPFHTTFGYHAHGVGIETATLPAGWQQRLVKVNTPATAGATGLCLEVNDLAVSKLVAGREKDLDFVFSLFAHKLADPAVVRTRLNSVQVVPHVRTLAEQRLARLARA